jgi:hypothetical protein
MRFGKTVSRRLGPAGLPITFAALSLIVAFAALPEISDAGFRLTHDDPADIADHTLAHTFTADVANRQIRTALDEGDIDPAFWLNRRWRRGLRLAIRPARLCGGKPEALSTA